MRSHFYLGSAAEWIRTIAAPLVGVAALAGVLHAAHGLGILPPARPMDNPDETLMVCKSRLIRSRNPAQVILLGDSTCGTGVEAPLLRRLLPGRPRVLNLGLYVGFGMDVYGEVLSDYVKHNPDEVKLVVLLVSPQFLRDDSAAPNALEFWHRIHQPEENRGALRHWGLSRLLGAELFKERLLRQVLRTPIPQASLYGFSSGLAQYLEGHDGSMVELGTFHPPAHPIPDRYYLSPTLERPSREFRRCLPAGAKLAIGLTPIPASVCPPGYRELRHEWLLNWQQWTGADYALTNSAATFGDIWFATRTHPNRHGQERFTRQLAASLSRVWGQ